MSKAEELADALMMQAKTLRLAGQNDAAVRDIETSSAELRRLAALEKAIMDAEPVAWRLHLFDYGVSHEGVYFVTQFPQQLTAWEKKGWAANPLYTLNGIKKP